MYSQSLSQMVMLAEEMWMSTSESEEESSTPKDSLSSTQSSSLMVNVKQIVVFPPTVNVPVSTAGGSKSLPAVRKKKVTIFIFNFRTLHLLR